MNTVTLIGNTAKDPEIINLESGKRLAKFSIATNDGWGDNKKANFHNVVAFGKVVDVIEKYVNKGDRIAITGSIDYNSYEKDRVKKYFTQILLNQLELLGGKKDQSTPQEPSNTGTSNPEDDDLPF